MNILLTSSILDSHTGAELHLRDLARALKKRGHHVQIYALIRGLLARDLEREGFEIINALRDVRTPPDVIHAQHQPALVAALRRFPGVPAIQIIHDATSPFDEPLTVSRVSRYVAVDNLCLARLLKAGVDKRRCETMLNFVDLDRFSQRSPLPEVAKRALVFTNYAKTDIENAAIMDACAANNIQVDFLGASTGAGSKTPEDLLPRYDIVFAKARAAIEAMAVGCAVILCDFRGLGGLVSPELLPELRLWNFGAAVLTRPITPDGIQLELARYDAGSAALVSARIRAEAGLDTAAERWSNLYERVAREPHPPMTPENAQVLRALANRWRPVMLATQAQFHTRGWRQSSGVRHAIYKLGRDVWRLVGAPGSLTQTPDR